MSHEGFKLAQTILEMSNQNATKGEDGTYYPRTSAVSRCPRDMTMHRYGEPWSDPPQGMWGSQFRFDLGYDCEDRVVAALKASGIDVQCEQMAVQATTRGGLKVLGHMDGIVVVPNEYSLGGKWYVMDVKSAGPYMYRRVYDEHVSKPKHEHMKQIGLYAESVIVDSKYPDLKNVKVSDLEVDGYEYGGGLVIYVAIDRPTKGYGDKKIEFPKMHICQFDIDVEEVELYLDVFDQVEESFKNSEVPGIPHPKHESIWGGIRCSPRWCNRYSVCQGDVEPKNPKLKEALHG
tara:strand:+ start:1440 stop:2309 length:870 start_codon:yes stop_codon:yes gene_type:complete